ncbi:hypothetical protein EVJ58_g7194 [Rhodofomes roseus]|uniref:J domain-containing protein n=1 Tax=Rhodofomes roseus TaxID=34475 RepID=A0A4Y9Y3U5_9APHY|nr:hypothetical protein EVJ58_g7194 [Rhodofomes roseus]
MKSPSPPPHWPADVTYIAEQQYHTSVPAELRLQLCHERTSSPTLNQPSQRLTIIRRISESAHPACGQLGLFAAKKIPPRIHIVDYIGEVHCDERPESDYDLLLCRTPSGLSVGVDARLMGNEARQHSDRRSKRISVHTYPSRLGKQRAFHASSARLAPKDPYQVLGVSKNANPAEIKKVYFSLARKYHPDTNPDKNAQEKFVEIQEAYDILKDEKKRADYDKYGAASQQPGFDSNAFANATGGFGDFSQFGGFRGSSSRGPGGLGDLFEQLFNASGGSFAGGRAAAHDMQGNDITASVGVTFMEACKGATRHIEITPVVNCTSCSGTGLKSGAKRSRCTTCGGTGEQSPAR